MKKTETRYVVERRFGYEWLPEGYASTKAKAVALLKEFTDGIVRRIVKVTTTREVVR